MNQQYDQLPTLINERHLDWPRAIVYGLLVEGAEFDATHTRLDDLRVTVQKRETLRGKSIFFADNGEYLAGLPIAFTWVKANTPYQVVLTWDDGRTEWLLGFYDEDADGNPLQVAQQGSLIVRPVIPEDGTNPIPDYGLWLSPEGA